VWIANAIGLLFVILVVGGPTLLLVMLICEGERTRRRERKARQKPEPRGFEVIRAVRCAPAHHQTNEVC